MGAIAIIPARGGSKRVPSKNLMPIAGLPLLAHSIRHARAAEGVDTVYVSTDDDEIAALARAEGAEVVERPQDIAGDTATSESALLHVLDSRGGDDPELVVFLQATSPVRRPGDIDAAIHTLQASGADSLFSAARDHRLIWRLEADGPKPVNYDRQARPREQDMSPQYRENGSIYVFKPALLREQGNRLGGKIAIHEMDLWTSFQLDSPEDAQLIEWIMRSPSFAGEPRWPERVELVVFDFDGVMTDNKVVVASDGGESVVADRGDGWGIARLRDAGVPMIVVSTEANPVVSARCEKLGIPCHQDIGDKAAYLADLLSKDGVDAANVIYVGNDVNDLEAMALVGLPVATADAHPDVAAVAGLVLGRRGGDGAVRELCDRLLARL